MQTCGLDSPCYLEEEFIAIYLNRPDIRQLLGAETPKNYTECSWTIRRYFDAHLDKYSVPTQYHVSGLLERGVPILIYAGTYDYRCNWVANKLFIDKLEWSGQAEYNAEEWRDWMVDGEKIGQTKSAGILTFATLEGAGHMGARVALSCVCALTNTSI